MTLSAPGNVLLLGEYAVLEEGGLGAAAAIDVRVRLEARAADGLSITGTWGSGSSAWTPEAPGSGPLVPAVVAAVEQRRRERRLPPVPRQRITIDSSAFYGAGGQKAGYGSSAAVCVALAAALLSDTGPARPCGPADRGVLEAALSAHRAAQGGQGSGYDVYASFFGGLGLFRGGRSPFWEGGGGPRLAHLFFFPGPQPVSTRDAIQRYRRWKAQNSGPARAFLEASNRIVETFFSSAGARETAAALSAARDLGIELGDAIGVSARIAAPAGLDPDLCKAVGAGNELGVYLCLPGAPEPSAGHGLKRADIAFQGLQWEP